MEDGNPYGVLGEYEDAMEEQDAPPCSDLLNSQEGWEDGEDIEGLDDESSQVEYQAEEGESSERRRKISQGPRPAVHQPNMTFAFTPVATAVSRMGRGGGTNARPELQVGSLPVIAETQEQTETDQVESAGADMISTVPPSSEPPESQRTTFTFRAQLTWGLAPGTRVHLPSMFREWVKSTSKHIPDFTLLPFEDEKGQGVSSPSQVPDDNPDFFKEYYHNHRVLRHGNLTGMVHFSCTVSWNRVKRMQDPYFQWLHQNKVYLNMAKFKSATLVVCGFLVGAHPGHFRRDDAEKELRVRLQLPEDFPFQLSSRTITVPKESTKESQRYSFPAVALETSARQAKKLREAFFALPAPAKAKAEYPYTGGYQFVPTLQSKEWPLHKIYQLAKVHVRICDTLKVIHIQNLQDIRNTIGPNGHTLLKGFLGMEYPVEGKGKVPVVHSVHNTGRPYVKAVLVHTESYAFALDQFATLHQGLLAGVPQEYHKNVFVDHQEVGLTSAHRDTIHSCNSSYYANELLSLYNPQDGEVEIPQESKRFKTTLISYAAAVNPVAASPLDPPARQEATVAQSTSISSLTDQDLDHLYERFKSRVETPGRTSPGISSEELEQRVQASNEEIQQVKEEMRKSVDHLAAHIENINMAVKKQNTVIAGLQLSLESTSKEIKANVDHQIDKLSSQIAALQQSLNTLLPPLTQKTVARSMGQGGS
jgi:hypothetical protein